jgi:uncharacterized protein with PQ loop repeat
MTGSELTSVGSVTVLAFTGFNGLRVISYLPQILKIWNDKHGSEAVSMLTWTLFGLSHLSTVLYAIIVAYDNYMATVFAMNAFCCAVIVGLTRRSRVLYAQNLVPLPIAVSTHPIC